MLKITSGGNKLLKHIKKLKQKKYRDDYCQFVVEGVKLFNEVLVYARDAINFVLVSDSFRKNAEKILDGLEVKIYTVGDELFDAVCQTQSPQGVLAVLTKRAGDKLVHNWLDFDFYLVLDRIADPGNMGANIRTAEAAGVDCVVLTKGCADVYNPKVLRSAMGSVFRMKFGFVTSAEQLLELKQKGVRLFATSLDGSVDLYSVNFFGKVAVVIGNESEGISDEVLGMCESRVKIDMDGSGESLNASVAAGIVLFEVKRQRSCFDVGVESI